MMNLLMRVNIVTGLCKVKESSSERMDSAIKVNGTKDIAMETEYRQMLREAQLRLFGRKIG